ncbi:sialate O-acetylesterase [Marinoscillum furvescens]|uniref:Sialate O-acetylesterase n=1 Tax=Marinoscillum furvescens DSM 4134 TaxID=1122208 RepID=A0A3D9L471_MARFU|nr:sialate O-acetylesterase [Marinoscillum furvescens]RED98410.1 sialate O-acetylesterase [Marinoscillum furvescens DSM 4134]
MKNTLSLVFLLFGVALGHLVSAEVRVHGLFSDGMVLQRNSQAPVWGWAAPGEQVIVTASWGARAETVASADSSWQVQLATPEAGGPFELTIAGQNTLTISDVWTGEVWLCTGQSNMDFTMSQLTKDAREPKYQPLVDYIRKEIATASDTLIRHIEVPRRTSIAKEEKDFSADWRSVGPEQTGKISATAYFFARKLRKALNVPVGLVECSWGGTRIQPWIPVEAYRQHPDLRTYFENNRKHIRRIIDSVSVEDFKDVEFEARFAAWQASDRSDSRPWPRVHPQNDKQVPATLYNGMLAAVVPYRIAGALWYQGESNSHFKEEEHELYFKTLISSWRAAWNQGAFPFYYVQLANYEARDKRSDGGWAMVNDAMRRGLELPNTGMAVLTDIGEAKDVHPHNKMDVGDRLARWALAKNYGVDVEAVSGPLFSAVKHKKGRSIVKFEQVGSGLMVGQKHLMEPTKEVDEPLVGFEIAGSDGVWYPAEATIAGKDKVMVSSDQVQEPVAVRFAWSSNPEGINLYNREGLPAATFTTP